MLRGTVSFTKPGFGGVLRIPADRRTAAVGPRRSDLLLDMAAVDANGRVGKGRAARSCPRVRGSLLPLDSRRPGVYFIPRRRLAGRGEREGRVRRSVSTSRICAGWLVAAVIAAAALAGCGGSSVSSSSSASVLPPSILTAPVQPTTFGQARSAVRALYRSHPGVAKATFNDVDYTSGTRDKVLSVCHTGGPESRRVRSSRPGCSRAHR